MKIRIIAMGVLLIPLVVFTEPEDSRDRKIDSLLAITKEIDKKVTKRSPIENRNFGIEINPVYPLLSFGEGLALTGGVQFFNLTRKAEISVPFQIITTEGDEYDRGEEFYSLDVHYRHFLGEVQKGFYVSGFARTLYMELGVGDLFDGSQTRFDDTRFGIGAGLGYRIYSNSRIYWGASFNLGRYLVYEEPDGYSYNAFFIGGTSSTIVDIEFFKFGVAF